MRNEDYGRIARILADGTPVELEFNIVNKVYPEGRTVVQHVAEIPGTDKKDEVVMLGGHLDSWHSATGATDNAIGCAIDDGGGAHPEGDRRAAAADDPRRALERRRGRAARIAGLRQGALRHRSRTRSRSTRSSTRYLNIDSGTGRARGAGVFGPPEAAAILRAGAGAVRGPRRRRRVGDHAAATSAAPTARRSTTPGCPASASARIRSNTTRTRTTPTSTPTSASSKTTCKASAIAIAATLYQLAMRDEMLPRFAPSRHAGRPCRGIRRRRSGTDTADELVLRARELCVDRAR